MWVTNQQLCKFGLPTFPARNKICNKLCTNNQGLKTGHGIQVVVTLFSKSDMGTSSKMSVWTLLQELLTAASPLAAGKNECYLLHQVIIGVKHCCLILVGFWQPTPVCDV